MFHNDAKRLLENIFSIDRAIEVELLGSAIKRTNICDDERQSDDLAAVRISNIVLCNSPSDVSIADIETFWRQFGSAITEEKKNRWQWIRFGLSKYLETLKQRDKLKKEEQFYVQQNAELNYFLQNIKNGTPHGQHVPSECKCARHDE